MVVNAFAYIAGKLSAAKKFLTAKDPFGLGAFSQPLKEGGIIRRVLDWFKNLKRFIPKSVLTAAEFGMKWAGKLGRWALKIGKLFMKAVRFVGKFGGSWLIKTFMKGLNKIFWPFQIIMSAIEFVKGFMSTKGDFVDKFIGGVKAVIKEFFGFPIALFGKLIDWVAEKFGIENLGAEKWLTDGFNNVIDAIGDFFVFIKDWIKDKTVSALNTWNDFSFVDAVKSVFDFLVGIWDKFIIKIHEWASHLPSWMIRDTELMKGLESMAEGAQEREADRLAAEQLKVQKETLEQQKMLNKKTLGNTQIIQNTSDNSPQGRMAPETTKLSRDVMTDSWAPALS
jgi:hypothetical protein